MRIWELTLTAMLTAEGGVSTPRVLRMRVDGHPRDYVRRDHAGEDAAWVYVGEVSEIEGYDNNGKPKWSPFAEGTQSVETVDTLREIVEAPPKPRLKAVKKDDPP